MRKTNSSSPFVYCRSSVIRTRGSTSGQYLAGREALAKAQLGEMDGDFIVLLSNSHDDRAIRAVGPVSGRLTAEASPPV